MTVIFTIGHSNHPADLFVALLRRHGVAQLADVRSRPASRFAPHFSKTALAIRLADAGISYIWLEALGGKPRDPALLGPDGRADYAKMATAQAFQAAVDDLMARAAAASTAVMCAERDPLHCHRTHLVAPALVSRGAEVQHILAAGALQPHTALQRPPGPQLDLFG